MNQDVDWLFSLRQWSALALLSAAVDWIIDAYPDYPPRDYEEFKIYIAENPADHEERKE